MRVIKGGGGQKVLVYELGDEEDRFFRPGGLLFYKGTRDPWTLYHSKKKGRCFYSCPGRSPKYDYERPNEACASAQLCYQKRLTWFWEEGVVVHDLHTKADHKRLQRDQLLSFIREKLT